MREFEPFGLHKIFVDDNTTFSYLGDVWTEKYGMLFLIAAIAYLPLVKLLQLVWKPLPALNLKYWRFIHNLAFCIFSTIGAVELTPTMINTITTARNFEDTVCIGYFMTRDESFWVIIFVASKLIELFETFYFVVEKKPIPFIHWYHHIMTFIFSSWALYLKDTAVLYYTWMNFSVHSIMYFYYCIVTISKSKPKWSIIITLSQIIQMFIGTAVLIQVYFCNPPHE